MSDWSSASSTTVKTRHNSRKTLESCTDSDASNSSSFITTTLSFLREQDDKEYSNREDEPGRQPSHSASVAEKQRVYSNKVGTLQDTSNQDCMSGDVALEVSSSFCQSISSEKEGQQQPPKRRGNAPQFTGTTRHQDLGTKKFDFGDLDFSIEETDDIVEGGEVNQSFVNTDQTESLQRITDQGSSNNVPGDRDPASESKANTCHHSEAGGGTFINVKSPRSVTSSRKEVYSDTKSSGTSTPSKSSSPRKFWFIPCTGICSRQVVAPFPDEENLSDLDETQTAGSEDQLDMAASSPEDMVPSQLKTHVKGVVWDFDKTVLKIHAYAKRISPAMVENRDLHEDFADLEGFRRVVYKLVNNEIPVGIASFGRKDVIQAYMDRAFPDRIFGENTISTPSTLNIEGLQDGQSVNGGKLLQLEQFIKKWGISRDQLVFFDGKLFAWEDCCHIFNASHDLYVCARKYRRLQ